MNRPPFFIDTSLTTQQISKPVIIAAQIKPMDDILKRQSKIISIYKNRQFDRQIKEMREQ